MFYTYMGFVETLQDILAEVFDKIFTPILQVALEVVIDGVGMLLKTVFSEILLKLLITLLKMLDFLANVFDVFSGYRDVGFQGRRTDLLSGMMTYGPVQRAFLMVTVLAVAIAFLFTIATVGKSISDMTLDNQRPVGKILGSGLKAAVTFALVPFMALFCVQLSTAVVRSVSDAIVEHQEGEAPSMGTIIFLTGGLQAARNESSNRSPTFTDTLRRPYYTDNTRYADVEQVMKDFDPMKFDLVISWVCTILVIIILLCGIFLFVQRIFEILVLYIVSPLFVSTMPFDDGTRFARWRDLFLAKVFSGFGVVFTMKLYLVLIPVFSNGSLILYQENGAVANSFVDSMLKVFIIIGGAWTSFKAQHMFLQILNPEAARAAQMGTAMMMGAISGIAGGSMSMLGAATGISRSGRRRKRMTEDQRSLSSVRMLESEPRSQAFRG